MGMGTALFATAAGAGLGALGAIQQGNEADAEGKYNAAAAKNEGVQAQRAAEQQAEMKQREVSRIMARQRLLIGSSGAGTGGTAEDVVAETAGAGELDALTLLYGGQVAKANSLSQAALYRARGKAAKTGGYLDALGIVLGAAGQAGYMSAAAPSSAATGTSAYAGRTGDVGRVA